MNIKIISPGSVMYRKEGGIIPRLLRYAPLTLSTLASLVPDELKASIELNDEIAKKINYNDRPDIVAISAITGTYKLLNFLNPETKDVLKSYSIGK